MESDSPELSHKQQSRTGIITGGKLAYSRLFESNYARDTQWPTNVWFDEKEKFIMSSKNNNKLNVPEARSAMDKFKMEAASEVGVAAPS